MSKGELIAVAVALVIAATAGGATALFRERDAGGFVLPTRARILSGIVAGATVSFLAACAIVSPTWFAVWFVSWWVTLFAVLPFGVRSQQEAGAVVAGSDPGAPVGFRLIRTAVLTTLASGVVFAVVVIVVVVFDVG